MPGFDYSLAPPLFTLVRFGRWSEVLAEPAPPADFKYLTAVWHFARGLALAATGRPAEAKGEHAALAAFVRALPKDAMLGPLNAAQAVFSVADAQLAGEIAARSGERAQALPLLEAAVRAEDALNYDEPQPWSQPARQSLGAVLLEAGDAKRAEAVFRADLARNPDNGWSLFGLAQALRRQRSAKAAAEAEQRFEKAWAKADVKLTAARF
jgi:tetratricopeptide (TPR) repeat protein